MVYSKELAKRLIREVEAGADPQKLAHALLEYKDQPFLKGILPNVIIYLERYLRQYKKKKSFLVEAATHLGNKTMQRIETSMIGTDSIDTNISLKPELIGGFRAQHADMFIDDSVAARLSKIRESLNRL